MNPGYVSSLIMIITLILCSSGWKQLLVRGISHYTILLFFAFWVVSSYIALPLSDRITVYLVFVLAAVLLAVCMFKIQSNAIRFHVISAGLLVGSLYFFLGHMLVIEPVYQFYLPFIHIPFSLGLIIILLYHQPVLQVAACSLALIIGHILLQWTAAPSSILLGDKLFQDHWWMMMLSVRIGSELWWAFRRACTLMLHTWNERKRG
jgi:hypothetical protein